MFERSPKNEVLPQEVHLPRSEAWLKESGEKARRYRELYDARFYTPVGRVERLSRKEMRLSEELIKSSRQAIDGANFSECLDLGRIMMQMGDYASASQAYYTALSHAKTSEEREQVAYDVATKNVMGLNYLPNLALELFKETPEPKLGVLAMEAELRNVEGELRAWKRRDTRSTSMQKMKGIQERLVGRLEKLQEEILPMLGSTTYRDASGKSSKLGIVMERIMARAHGLLDPVETDEEKNA